jgi:hypothetical protein
MSGYRRPQINEGLRPLNDWRMTDEVPHGRQVNCTLFLPLKLYLYAVNGVGSKKNDRMVVSDKLWRNRAFVCVCVCVCVCSVLWLYLGIFLWWQEGKEAGTNYRGSNMLHMFWFLAAPPSLGFLKKLYHRGPNPLSAGLPGCTKGNHGTSR